MMHSFNFKANLMVLNIYLLVLQNYILPNFFQNSFLLFDVLLLVNQIIFFI